MIDVCFRFLVISFLVVGSLFSSSCTRNEDVRTFTVNGYSFDMVYVEGGDFCIGVQSDNPDESNYDSLAAKLETPSAPVVVQNFLIGKHEVTQGLWKAVMGKNCDRWTSGQGDSIPVYQVSYNEALAFIDTLNSLLHDLNALGNNMVFCLPSEYEWEFAARGGNLSHGFRYSGSSSFDDVAWVEENSSESIHRVALKLPNELGIYDMSGNVWEWCSNPIGKYGSVSSDVNSFDENVIALRGGGYSYDKHGARVHCRGYNVKTYRDDNLGFRLCLKSVNGD